MHNIPRSFPKLTGPKTSISLLEKKIAIVCVLWNKYDSSKKGLLLDLHYMYLPLPSSSIKPKYRWAEVGKIELSTLETYEA